MEERGADDGDKDGDEVDREVKGKARKALKASGAMTAAKPLDDLADMEFRIGLEVGNSSDDDLFGPADAGKARKSKSQAGVSTIYPISLSEAKIQL